MAEKGLRNDAAKVIPLNGIILDELINSKDGMEFSIEAPGDVEEELLRETRVDTTYDYHDYENLVNLDCLSVSETDDCSASPFDLIASRMTDVTADGGVKKQVKRAGLAGVVSPDATCYLHYSCYLEMEEVPFDSSYLRSSKPLRHQLGENSSYPGFEVAVASMAVGEKSQFLISPFYAFREMGVPPRIPPNATILLEVDLLRAIDTGTECDGPGETADMEDLKHFPAAFKKAKKLHLLGNDAFSGKNYSAAADFYKKAVNVLTGCSLNSDEEEGKQKQLLVKLYVNLSICYNKLHMPERVCISAREATYYDPYKANQCAKLHFNWGKALTQLGDFKRATDHYKIALKLEPNNKELARELVNLEKRRKDYYQHEKICYQKALGLNKGKADTTDSPTLKSGEEEALTAELAEFARSNNSILELPGGLTKEEKEVIRRSALSLGLSYKEGRSTLLISK